MDELTKFKKNNKARREIIAKNLGYASADAYMQYLDKPDPAVKEQKSKLTDIIIAFDVTGSMSSYHQHVKKYATETVKELFQGNPGLRIGIVAFGDYCDMKGKDNFGNAYQFLDLTDDVAKIVSFIRNVAETSGGDADEFYEVVIHKLNTEPSWRLLSDKSVLFIADANPHPPTYKFMIGQDNFSYHLLWEDVARTAATLGIKYDTLSIHGHNWYVELSRITGGTHMLFNSSHKTNQVFRGYTAARSGDTAKFETYYAETMSSGDTELIGVYKTLSTL